MGYRSLHPGFSETKILRGNLHPLVGTTPRPAPPVCRGTNIQSSVKRKTPEFHPTPTVMPPTTRRGRSLKQDPEDVIDLTLDSSDFESFNTPPEVPPSPKSSGDPQTVRLRPTIPAHPPSEGTCNDNSIHGFSAGSPILDPALNLGKEPHDKPRLFVRYMLDFTSCLANISAHGLVDQVRMSPVR